MAKLSKKIFALAAAVSITLGAAAQEKTDNEFVAPEGFYKPTFFGTVMTTLNVSTYNGYARFNVRNSRFGFKGNVSRDFTYQVQIDFSNQGSVSVLDSYMKYKTASKDKSQSFDVAFGQQRINLSEDMKRGPSSCLFSSRSYAAISSIAYIVDDSGNVSLSSLGSRDIGVYANYSFMKDRTIPVMLGVGLFNGNGANNPEWDSTLNVTARVVLGNMKDGWSSGASYYGGKNPASQDINIWTAEMRYLTKEFMIESTYQQRRVYSDKLDILQVANVQGYYNFFTPSSNMFSHIAPHLRWDIGDNVDYLLLDSDSDSTGEYMKLNSHRLTAAMNFHFKGEKFRSRMTVGYEKFFMGSNPADMAYNPLMHDKFTVSFVGTF